MTFIDDVQRAFAGRYQLESEIGEGGSARVFVAQDLKHDRRVAIKILKAGIAQSIAADRFLREIRIDAGLHHPRILPLFDSGEVLGLPYFVMPFVAGSTLRSRLQREGTIPVGDAVRIAAQVAEALSYLHSRGFVHRDVKPENILLQDDHVWLADFGIVRALQDAVTGNQTLAGMAIGTPAYMSPEQRIGAPLIDGQSDQFSLAVVLYEMLAGRLPNLFENAGSLTTPNGPRITPMRAVRTDVPHALDDVLTRALQVDENARWPSMRVFAEKLADPSILTPQSTPIARTRRWPLSYLGVALAAGAVLVFATWYRNTPAPLPLDPLKVAVLPLAHERSSAGGFLDGDDCSQFLRDAIARWTGIHHVDEMELRDLRRRMGRPETLDGAMRMARQLRAGLAVWGVVKPPLPNADTTSRLVHVYLYDVARGVSGQEARATVKPSEDLTQVFQLLADSLLTGTTGRSPATRVSGSRDYLAVRAYLDGHRALDSFNLSTAALAFRHAIERDRDFGLAYLWLAWSTLWLPDGDAKEWGAAAEGALTHGVGLTANDSVHARALVSMRDRRNADACDLYRSLLAADDRDFAAWYGLGECLSSDVMVIPDAASKSKWRFQSSMHEAVGAYEKAVDLVPSFTNAMGQRALQRISRWLYAQTGRYRLGMSEDSARFAAWPSLSGDTLAFIPFPARDAMSVSPGTREPSYHQALQRNREHVLALVNRWVASDSSNGLALETLALAREANDELSTLRRSESGLALTGFAALRRARARAPGDAAVRLAATEVRFLVKADRLSEARGLADSLLRAGVPDSANASTASYLHSLAMLTGRAQAALLWGRRSSAYQYNDPLRPGESVSSAVSMAASDAATFAALGAPADSTRAALARLERALSGLRAPSIEVMRQQYVEQPLLFAWPSLGVATIPPTRPSSGNRWLDIQLALARGDTTSARTGMWQADSSATAGGISEIAFEIALLNSRLWLALHDTASALRVVDNAVDLVGTSGDQLIRRSTATASYVRLLVQRSVLADQRGDTASARAWGTRAWALWRDVDPMIAEVMRPVARWRTVPLPGGTK